MGYGGQRPVLKEECRDGQGGKPSAQGMRTTRGERDKRGAERKAVQGQRLFLWNHLFRVLKGRPDQGGLRLWTRIKLYIYDMYTLPCAYYTSIKVTLKRRDRSSLLNTWKWNGRGVKGCSKHRENLPSRGWESMKHFSNCKKVPTGCESVLRIEMTKGVGQRGETVNGRQETIPEGLKHLLRVHLKDDGRATKSV